MLKPSHFVVAARVALVLGSVTVAVLTLGPFQGAEQIFGLNDKAAHAIAFGGLLAIAFLAFPRMRRTDLVIAALILGGAVEIAQLFDNRSASVLDWLADAGGILTIYAASMIETVRKMARDQGELTFNEIAAMDRRRTPRRASAVFEPRTRQDAPSFAQRASRHFPVR